MKTHPHRTDQKQYEASVTVELETATNNTPELIKYAVKALEKIYRPGYLFKKCGVVVLDLVEATQVQHSLFATGDRAKNKRLMDAMDGINKRQGKDTVRIAVQGYDKKYRVRAEHLSPCYTTNISHLLKVN